MIDQKLQGAIDRICRRIFSAIAIGRKTTGDDSGNVQTHQIKIGADEIKDNTPRLAEFGFTSMPPDGSDFVVLFSGGDRLNGIIIASGDIATRLKNLQPGESALYDSAGKHIYLKSDKIEVDAKNQPVSIINASTIDITTTGNVTVNCGGDLTLNVTGNINSSAAKWSHDGEMEITGKLSATDEITSSVDVKANGISLKTHVHGGVYSGTSTTGVPQ